MRVAIFEGPVHSFITGWRHYQICWFENNAVRKVSCINEPGSMPSQVARLQAFFFHAGTWETPQTGDAKTFATPRPEILAIITGRREQTELAV